MCDSRYLYHVSFLNGTRGHGMVLCQRSSKILTYDDVKEMSSAIGRAQNHGLDTGEITILTWNYLPGGEEVAGNTVAVSRA